jgi:NAD-dependent deacetylase
MQTVVIFSGAGLSAESGVPTFRDSNGLWENHKVEDVASPEGWDRDQETVLRFYQERFNGIQKCEPNAAHKAIARLQDKFNVVNITQNIDDLLERAGCTNVQHIHGSILERKCSKHRNCSVLDGDTIYTCDYLDKHTAPVVKGDLCPKCGEQTRPNVVWFGEAVDMAMDDYKELVRDVKYNNGVFITVGTSAQVYPAAYLISWFSQVKNKYIIDKNPKRVGDYTCLTGEAGTELPKLVEFLMMDGV